MEAEQQTVITPKESEESKEESIANEQTVTPWEVGSKSGFDYMKLIRQFGTEPITGALIERFERLTNMKAHHWLRRGIFFSHREMNHMLDLFESGEQVYLYTGRGPTSEAMHLGHMLPFMFSKYLQDALGAIIMIQMSDDEKFFFKPDGSLDYYNSLTYKNARDIIACGFNPNKTYIFSNMEQVGSSVAYYMNFCKVAKETTGTMLKGTFGFALDGNFNAGMLMWPSMQCTPAYSSSFPDIFGNKKVFCFVPMAIDQAPYFRMARDIASKIGERKPGEIHSKFLIGLGGINDKMSSSTSQQPIFLTDTVSEVKKKINRCFSGGQDTVEKHRELGANLIVDVPYQYLCHFIQDDAELKRIAEEYSSGRMLTSDIKKILIDIVQRFLANHQGNRDAITDENISRFFDMNKPFDDSRPVREPVVFDEDYSQFGIGFDIYFGCAK